MKTKVQEFLASNPVEALTERYAIAVKRHPQFPNLVMLKYDQIGSPMGEPIVQECRGIILDEDDGWRVVSYPFRKFFNYGEGHAAPINWPTARVYEKLDGSLMTLYWYAGEWRVASSGLPDAGGLAHGSGMTFADLFWQTWNECRYKLPGWRGCCFMFELMTPYNRVVVPHSKSRLVAIGGRDLETMQEIPSEHVGVANNWDHPRWFYIDSLVDCVAAAAQLKPMEQEGYVVCDVAFNRVKVKSPAYVALAHMKENFCARRMLEVVRTNESTEFLTYFPEMREVHDKVRARFESVCLELDAAYEAIRHIEDRKAFAIEAVKSRCSTVLFARRDGKATSAADWLSRATIQAVERAVPVDDVEVTEAVAA